MIGAERPVVALFDLDNTLADFWGEMCRRLQLLRAPQELAAEPVPYEEDLPAHIKERMRLVKNTPGFWLNLPIWKPGFEILEEARRLGMQIEVLTKGPRHTTIAWTEKVQWCQRNLGDVPHQVTITMDKGLVYGRLLVDDYPDYVSAWLRWRKRGFVIMPAHPWNEGFAHPQVYRYHGNRPEMVRILETVVARAREQMPSD
jgi:5'-nucleotidase